MTPEAAILMAGALAGALVSSFAGFALAPVAGAILLIALPAKTVIPVLMICSILVQTATLIYLRRSLVFGSVGTMLIGGALGAPLAVLLFQRLDAGAFQVGFGLFLAVYALVMLTRPCARLRIARSRGVELGVGFLGGLVGGLTAMPGAVPVLYCDCTGAGKEAQRAFVQPFILAMQVWALALLALGGDVHRSTLDLVALALPALALGTVVGLALFGRVPDVGFRRAVLVLLLGTGLALAFQASHGCAGRQATGCRSDGAVADLGTERAWRSSP